MNPLLERGLEGLVLVTTQTFQRSSCRYATSTPEHVTKVDPDGEACVLTLRTRRDDRIIGAGPLLQEAGDASMVLQVRQDGSAVASDGKWRLQRVAADEVAAVKADRSGRREQGHD